VAREDFGDGTRAVRAGLPEAGQGEPFLPGPTFAAPYHLRGRPEDSDFVYGRYGNPTWSRYEAALAELEGGAAAVVFASGMAALSALLLPRLRPGDVLVAPADSYRGTRILAERYLQPMGVEVRLAPTPGDAMAAQLDGATFLLLETPTNPQLEVCDIRALADAAHERGALVAVDNTFATPLGQRPLELGADFSVASASKMLTGHADLILGYVATRDSAHPAITAWRTMAGSVPGPFEVWLAHRSLATLGVRLERQCATALALAQALAERDDVSAVRYPGLEGDPSHELAARQMTRFGPILSFDVGSQERADRFLAECRLVSDATSFGGVHTSAERRARWSGDAVSEGFIRFSAGCEETADVVGDVLRALDTARS